jgi:hypothetical protein
MIETSFHVLVWTNGEVAVDQNVPRLYVISSHGNRADYSLAVFRAPANAHLKCCVKDLGKGEIQAYGVLRLKKYSKGTDHVPFPFR